MYRIRPFYPLARRYQSTSSTPRSSKSAPDFKPSVFIEDNFAKHTLFVLDVAKRAIKFSLFGLFTLGAFTAAAFEGAHQWVETVELAPEQDGEMKRWQWDDEMEKWSGDAVSGGTDRALGIRGRHTVRAAWMAYNWGIGRNTTAVVSPDALDQGGLVGLAGLKVVDASMQKTRDFLHAAITIADSQLRDGRLHPDTIPQLLLRYGNVLERLGDETSKSQYERAFLSFSGRGMDAARIAAKLGDINRRLGQTDEALSWWSRAIQITRGDIPGKLEAPPAVLGSAPTSPYAQRILSNTLVSLSAFYARSGQLHQAQAIEEAALDMLHSVSGQFLTSISTAPCTLHALYLLQRSSLLSIHLAEVLHAQHEPVSSSIRHLTSAAESSEKIARALTGRPASLPGGFPSDLSHSDPQLLPTYSKSRSMKKTANSLFRDSRRTAAEAWNLAGILKEAHSKNPKEAFDCYEQAVRWAGAHDPQSRALRAAEGILESDWAIFWGNYTRTKQFLEEKL